MTLLAHAARSIGLDHNPMRRRTDRIEGWARLTTTIMLVLVAPLAAGLAARAAYLDGTRTEEQQRAARHQIQAVLLQDATYSSSTGVVPTVLTLASWQAPDGTTKTGWVRAKIGSVAGSSVPVWIGSNGVPADAPREHEETVAVTIATAVLVPIGAALLLGLCQLGLRMFLDRRRMAAWQDAWARVEPGWCGRQP